MRQPKTISTRTHASRSPRMDFQTGLIVLGFLALAGCAGTRIPADPEGTGGKISEVELQQELFEFADDLTFAVKRAAGAIESGTTGRKIRKNVLEWKYLTVSTSRQALTQDDPRNALLDLWTMCVGMVRYLTEGEGSEWFGEWQDIPIRAFERLTQQIENVAARVLTEDQLVRTHDAIEAYVVEKSPEQGIVLNWDRRALGDPEKGGIFESVLRVPMAPYKALTGIDSTAQAIRYFADATNRFNAILEVLPEETRWQTELLLFEFEELEMTASAVESVQTVAESAERLSRTADSLPEEIRTELSTFIEEVDQKQASIQVTLDKARDTVDSVSTSLARVKEITRSVEEASFDLAQAGDAWKGTFNALDEMVANFKKKEPEPPGSPPRPAGRPFDITEYGATARDFGQAAAEVTRVMTELNNLLKSDRVTALQETVDSTAKSTVEMTAEQAKDLIDHAVWRIGQLVLVLFAAAVIYRILSVYLAVRKERKAPESSGPA